MIDYSRKPRVLVADDDELGRLFLVETLEQAGFDVACAADGIEARRAALDGSFRLALLDVDMPGLDGYEVCRFVRSHPDLKYLPIVMITGHDDAHSIERAFDAGATDFIAKPLNWTLLPHRLRYILRNASADEQLRFIAYFDPLTGFANSQALTDIVAAAIANAGGTRQVAILHIDVQGCSRIRSIFGPQVGDQALRAFAGRLKSRVDSLASAQVAASIARIDGDRFVVCLAAAHAAELAPRLAEDLKGAMDTPVTYGSHQFFLRLVTGIAWSPTHGRDATVLMTAAAAAKQHALDSATPSAVTYSKDIGDRALERLALEEALRNAVAHEHLVLYFQPKIRIADGSLAGVEALLRWTDDNLGQVSPESFVPLAEESGLILQIGRWVAQAACRQVMNWRDQGFDTSIAINVSAHQFMHDDPAAFLRATAQSSGVDPRSIAVEITESALIRDLAGIRGGLIALRRLGCRIAIDDFGTGYSSLAYLKGLPVDELKIDKAFIRNVASDHVDGAICTAILSLAQDIGLKVTAEGVETESQLEWLRSHGCAEAQGFLVGPPMSAIEIVARYANDDAAARSGLWGTGSF
jgi:diguanylate cyclase (GGDEF)-like protein